MTNCPVKNCAAKTRSTIALTVAGVMTLVAVILLLMRFFPQLDPFRKRNAD